MNRFFCLAALGLALTSCLRGGGDTCTVTTPEPTLAVSGPKTIAVNQQAKFLITYLPQNTCAKLESIYEAASSGANTYVIGPRVTYTDCNCPANTITAQTTYAFTPTKAGTYYLNFIANTTSGFITDTLVAQ